MEEHYEVPPASQRVVWLNGQHMKPMLAFEALTRALGWGYNHHKPQVVWQQDCSVRLEVPKVRRVRGHTSHAHPQATPTAINTHVQMGTYLTFYLERRSSIQKCCLVLDGLEAVKPREGGGDVARGNRILITRLGTAANGHALEYPKGVSHDGAPLSPVDIASRTLTAERLSTSPSKLSTGGKAFGLSRTSNRQQSSKASRSGRSCSKRKRQLRLTPARNTTGDDAPRIEDALGEGVTADEAGDGNGTTQDTSDVSEQKCIGNLTPRSHSGVENVGQVSDQLRENQNLRIVPENLPGQNDASRQMEPGNGNTTFNASSTDKVEKLTNCSNKSDLDARSPKQNVINGREKDGCGTNMRSNSSTKRGTATSHHSKLESEHSSDLNKASGMNRAKGHFSSKSPMRNPGTPYRDSLGVSEDMWSVEADLSSPDEFTAILSDEDSDSNDEWEDEDDEDIYKVVRQCISADITALLHQPSSPSVIETSNCSFNSTELNAARSHKKNHQCSSSIGCPNNINNGTALASPDGSIEDLNGTRTRCVNPDRERNNSSEDHRNDRNCGTSVLEPRNPLTSSAGVGIYTHSDGSQDEGDAEQGRRGSLDPELLLNAGNRPQGMRKVEGEASLSNNDENAFGMVRIEGRKEERDCEKMIKLYEQKIRLSKENSNQHASANDLIEEIVESRWNKTQLRKFSNNRLDENSELKHPSVVNCDNETTKCNSHIDPCNKPNTIVPLDSECTEAARPSANNSDSTKESLFQNGDSPRASNTSPSIALSSCPSVHGISTTLSPSCDGTNVPEPGELLMLLLRPSTPQQAWQFQSAHLTVWYRSRDQRRPSTEEGARRPPQRTRLTYRSDTRPYNTRGLTPQGALHHKGPYGGSWKREKPPSMNHDF